MYLVQTQQGTFGGWCQNTKIYDYLNSFVVCCKGNHELSKPCNGINRIKWIIEVIIFSHNPINAIVWLGDLFSSSMRLLFLAGSHVLISLCGVTFNIAHSLVPLCVFFKPVLHLYLYRICLLLRCFCAACIQSCNWHIALMNPFVNPCCVFLQSGPL